MRLEIGICLLFFFVQGAKATCPSLFFTQAELQSIENPDSRHSMPSDAVLFLSVLSYTDKENWFLIFNKNTIIRPDNLEELIDIKILKVSHSSVNLLLPSKEVITLSPWKNYSLGAQE